MIHTPDTVRALTIGERLAAQVVAMRVQRIGGRSLTAYLAAQSVGAFYDGERAPLPAGVEA